MYVLIMILTIGSGGSDVRAFPQLLPSLDQCNVMGLMTKQNLMAKKPEDIDGYAQYMCIKVPEKV